MEIHKDVYFLSITYLNVCCIFGSFTLQPIARTQPHTAHVIGYANIPRCTCEFGDWSVKFRAICDWSEIRTHPFTGVTPPSWKMWYYFSFKDSRRWQTALKRLNRRRFETNEERRFLSATQTSLVRSNVTFTSRVNVQINSLTRRVVAVVAVDPYVGGQRPSVAEPDRHRWAVTLNSSVSGK